MDKKATRCGLRKRFFARLYPHAIAKYERYIQARKRELFADLPKTVLEIGPAMGSNLKHLKPGSTWIGLEPNLYMHPALTEESANHSIDAEIRSSSAEQIDLDDERVEAVICTLVLCSVKNLERSLAEIRRVLRPRGKLYFIEHVAAPRGTWLRRWQALVSPAWNFFGDGCRPDRETVPAIEHANFSLLDYEQFRVPFPEMLPLTSPHVAGVAVK